MRLELSKSRLPDVVDPVASRQSRGQERKQDKEGGGWRGVAKEGWWLRAWHPAHAHNLAISACWPRGVTVSLVCMGVAVGRREFGGSRAREIGGGRVKHLVSGYGQGLGSDLDSTVFMGKHCSFSGLPHSHGNWGNGGNNPEG